MHGPGAPDWRPPAAADLRVPAAGGWPSPPAARPPGSRRSRWIVVLVVGLVVVLVAVAVGAGVQRLRSSSVEVLWMNPTESVSPTARAAAGVAVMTDGDSLRGLDATTGEQRWKIARPMGDVVVSGDRVYAQCCFGDTPGPTTLVALNPADGKALWRAERSNAPRAIPMTFAPATPAGDLVVVSSNDDEVFALDASSGKQRWSVKAPVFGTPTVSGGVVAVAGAGRAVGIDLATGHIRWELRTAAGLELNDPAVLGTEFVFTSTALDDSSPHPRATASVIAVDAKTGAKAWEHPTDAAELTAPVVVGGAVVTGVHKNLSGQDSGVLAFDGTSAKPVWTVVGLREVQTPVAGPAGVYVASDRTHDLVALDARNGSVEWTYEFSEIGPDPVVVADGRVWAAGDADQLVALDPGSGAVDRQYRASASIVSLESGDNKLFLGTYGDGLFALSASP